MQATGRRSGARTPLLGLGVLLAAAALVWIGLFLFAPGTLPGFIRPQPAPSPTPAQAQASPEGRLSFVRASAEGLRDLFVVNPDGTGQQQVTRDIMVWGADWSPDGRQIVLAADVDRISTVARLDIGPDNRAASAVQLTADIKVDSILPSWSPNGKQIVFQSKRDGGDYQIFVMDADGNNKLRLSDGQGYATHPAWSPDGVNIVYRAGQKGDPGIPKELFVVPAAGGTPRQITAAGKDLSNPQWSPDGKQIVYLENLGQRASIIHIMNSDGSGDRVLVDQGANSQPEFSPDGTRIAYYSVSPERGSDIFIVPAAGGATSNLTHLTTDDYSHTWSFDGQMLAWASKREGQHKIVASKTDGSGAKVISSGDGDDYQPEWGFPVEQAMK